MTVAVAELAADWPANLLPRHLRGAVITELAPWVREEDLPPWTGREPDGTQIQAPARVCYRTATRPHVFTWGAGARKRAEDLAYHLTALRTPSAEPVAVRGVRVRVGEVEIGVLRERWVAYEFVTPYWPSSVVEARRPPRGQEWATEAWASYALEGSLRHLLAHVGIEIVEHRPLHVALAGPPRFERLVWERPQRGTSDARTGFRCRFAANVDLPDGFGLGGKTSEGFGELRRC